MGVLAAQGHTVVDPHAASKPIDPSSVLAGRDADRRAECIAPDRPTRMPTDEKQLDQTRGRSISGGAFDDRH